MLEKGERLTNRHNRSFTEKGLERILVPFDEINGKYFAKDIFNKETGEIFAEAGEEINEAKIEILTKASINKFDIIIINDKVGPYVRNTLQIENNTTRAESLAAIYKIMRPGEPPTEESSEKLFFDLFFSRIEGKNITTNFYSNRKEDDRNNLSLNKEVIEQEGVWILKKEKEWSLVTIGTLARKDFSHNLWVKNDDIVKLESEKYDLSAVGRVS